MAAKYFIDWFAGWITGTGCNGGSMKMCSAAFAILTVMSFAADASVLYNYAGPNFTLLRNTDPQSLPYDTTMHISGFIRFSDQLAPLTRYQSPSSAGVESFSFFDGIQTISSENGGYFSEFELNTDEHGQFFNDSWLINAWIGDASVESEPWAFILVFGSLSQYQGETVLVSGDMAGLRQVCIDERTGLCPDNRALAANVFAGTWTLQPIPVPSAGLLFALCIGSVAALNRKPNRRQVQQMAERENL